MKLPRNIITVRHAESALNELHTKKYEDAEFMEFLNTYRENADSPRTLALAQRIQRKRKYKAETSDHYSPITELGREQSYLTGARFRQDGTRLPHIVTISDYTRVIQTYEAMIEGWPQLSGVPLIKDGLLREQELGLANLYGDFELFFALNPRERELFELEGGFENGGLYSYRFPRGENVPDVRKRARIWFEKICREHSGKRVMVISHFNTLLAIRTNLENFGREEYDRLYDRKNTKRINCAVSEYSVSRFVRRRSDRKLKIVRFNKQLW